MTKYLFKINPANAAEYAKAEQALKACDMWLEQGVVSCSAARGGQGLDSELEEQAYRALEAAQVMVYPS
jgi:hypothetical protein